MQQFHFYFIFKSNSIFFVFIFSVAKNAKIRKFPLKNKDWNQKHLHYFLQQGSSKLYIMDSVSGYFSLHYHPRDSVVDYKKPGTQRIFVFLNFCLEPLKLEPL